MNEASLLHVYQLHIEEERRVLRDPRHVLLPVSQVWRDHQPPAPTHLHIADTDVPTLDHRALA